MIVIYCKKWKIDIRPLITIRIIKSFLWWAASPSFSSQVFVSLLLSIQRSHCKLLLCVLGCGLHKKLRIFFCTIVKPVANSTRTIACLLFCLHLQTPQASIGFLALCTVIVPSRPLYSRSAESAESFPIILPRKKLLYLLGFSHVQPKMCQVRMNDWKHLLTCSISKHVHKTPTISF